MKAYLVLSENPLNSLVSLQKAALFERFVHDVNGELPSVALVAPEDIYEFRLGKILDKQILHPLLRIH